jgi:hypothetical protein
VDHFHSVGHNEIIGVCQVGNEAERLGRDHWSEMLSYPRKPIAHWHSLVEVRATSMCSTLQKSQCFADEMQKLGKTWVYQALQMGFSGGIDRAVRTCMWSEVLFELPTTLGGFEHWGFESWSKIRVLWLHVWPLEGICRVWLSVKFQTIICYLEPDFSKNSRLKERRSEF